MSFLDKVSKSSMQALVVSGIILWTILILAGLYNLLSQDPVIGYTEHGIPVLESELEKNNEQN